MAESERDIATTGDSKKPLLELSTLAPERPHIVIDGERYEMALPQEYGLLEQARMQRFQREALAAQEAIRRSPGDVGEEMAARMSDMLRGMVAIVLPALPEEVAAKLTDAHRLRIIEVFTRAVSPTPNRQARRDATAHRARRRTGATSSLASSASTGGGHRSG